MSNFANSAREPDPQIVVTGELRRSRKNSDGPDIITFSFSLIFFEIVAVVTVPFDGTTSAPVYLKFRIKDRQ